MAGIYQTLKNWNSNDILYAADVDAEFQNVRNNMIATSVEGYSTINNVFSLTRAKAEIDPAPSGIFANCVDNQTMAGEIEKLRFVIHRMVDGGLSTTSYATTPSRSLASSSAYPLAWYFPFNGQGTLFPWTDLIRRGGIINSQTPASPGDFPQTQIDTTLANAKYGLVSLKCGGVLAVSDKNGSQDEGTVCSWFRNLSAGDYIITNPTLGISLYCAAGTGYLTASLRLPTAASNSAKTFQTVASTGSQIGNTSYQSTSIRWSLNQTYGSATDQFQLLLGGSTTGLGTQLTAQTFNVNTTNTGNWFIGAKENNPSWASYDAMNVLPSANGWTGASASSAPAPTVANGILTFTGTSSNPQSMYYYYKQSASTITGVSLSSMIVDFKLKMTGAKDEFNVTVRDNSLSRGFSVSIFAGTLYISTLSNPNYGAYGEQQGTFTTSTVGSFNNWTWVRLVSSGSPNPTLSVYIDGVFAASATLIDADTINAGNNYIGFAVFPQTGGAQLEWMAYHNSALNPLVANSSSGNLADIGAFTRLVTDTNLLATIGTSTTQLSSVIGSDIYQGIKGTRQITVNNVGGLRTYGSNISGSSGTVWATGANFNIVSDGKSQIQLNGYALGRAISGAYNLMTSVGYLDGVTYSTNGGALNGFGVNAGATQGTCPPTSGALTALYNVNLQNVILPVGIHNFTFGTNVSNTTGASGINNGYVIEQNIVDLRY